MQTSNVKIKFETLNDHNFNIEISGSDGSVLQGLALLQEELPSEISFHVPESYHKRIIGVGGRSIQRIMKKYGVYVKFSNAEEFAQLGGYTDNEDNVIARTPFKNHMNLESLKLSVMELVNEKVRSVFVRRIQVLTCPQDRDFINQTVLIPHQLHRKLLGEKHVNIEDIEAKTNSRISFPGSESGSDVVTIYGPEQQIENAQTRLLVRPLIPPSVLMLISF
jgi:predicted PilT family ATPase